MVAQFTAKTTNSKKAIYFFHLYVVQQNKPKSHILNTYKHFMFSDFTREKKILLHKIIYIYKKRFICGFDLVSKFR